MFMVGAADAPTPRLRRPTVDEPPPCVVGAQSASAAARAAGDGDYIRPRQPERGLAPIRVGGWEKKFFNRSM